MAEAEIIFDPENKIDQIHGYYMFFASIAVFSVLNVVITFVGPPAVVQVEPWKWNNLLISWLHGAVCGAWDILCFVFYPEMLDDLIHHINYFTYLMVAFSAGYFVYDFLDLLIRGKLIACWEVTLHHIAVASMFWYNFHARMCIGYNVIALMAEINSFWLHSRKLLHMLKFEFTSTFYRAICYVNLLTFFFCRGGSLCRLSYGMLTESHRVPTIYFRFLIASIFVMNVINPVLFWRLLKSDVLRSSKSGKKNHGIANGDRNQNTHIKAT